MFVDTAYFIFYKTNKNVLKKDDGVAFCLRSRLHTVACVRVCLVVFFFCHSVASLTHFDSCKNKPVGKGVFFFFLSPSLSFSAGQGGFIDDSDHLDGTISLPLSLPSFFFLSLPCDPKKSRRATHFD